MLYATCLIWVRDRRSLPWMQLGATTGAFSNYFRDSVYVTGMMLLFQRTKLNHYVSNDQPSKTYSSAA